MQEFKKLTREQIATYVKEIIAGNEEHFPELYEEMRRMCHLQCKFGEYYFDHYLTEEDFFQDTVCEFWKYKHLYDENKGAFVTWYNTLITHLYIAKYKKRKRQLITVPLETQIRDYELTSYEDVMLPALSAEDAFFENYNEEQLINKIKELKPDSRDALLLKGIHQLSGKEAAEIAGVSEYTFNVRACRARKMLEEKLEEIGLER